MAERLQSSIQIHLALFTLFQFQVRISDFHNRKSHDWLSEGRWFYPEAWLGFLTDNVISRVTVHV